MDNCDQFSYIPRPDKGINIVDRLFIIAADLGQANDYTAISIIERLVKGDGIMGPEKRGIRSLRLRHIERPVRGTPYPDIVDRILELYRSPQLEGTNKSVVIDLTGLGRPVYDLMRSAGFNSSLSAISITGGMDVTYGHSHYNVPKRDLISSLQVNLQNNTLRIAKNLKEADVLVEELANFQTRISDDGRDTYGGRSGVHDDIVLSVAMGTWLACRRHVRWGNDKYM